MIFGYAKTLEEEMGSAQRGMEWRNMTALYSMEAGKLSIPKSVIKQ